MKNQALAIAGGWPRKDVDGAATVAVSQDIRNFVSELVDSCRRDGAAQEGVAALFAIGRRPRQMLGVARRGADGLGDVRGNWDQQGRRESSAQQEGAVLVKGGPVGRAQSNAQCAELLGIVG
eukprot:scaffold2047_cov119-Isochrysis_galbana.AAC.2